MQIDVLIEAPSAEEALRIILPKILAGRANFRLINMRNKSRLIGELPATDCAVTKNGSRLGKI